MDELVPSEFYLSQNYPDPFIEKTIIKYCVAYKTKVILEVFDIESKMIKILIDEEKEAGTYEVEFNAYGLPDGIYIYQFQAGNFLETKKMMLLC
jgi:hypothetical protein